MQIFPHNRQAADKVLEAFAVKNRAAVVHSTGTGKSYIIAAVASHFKRPLVIAPNNFVLGETRKICAAETQFQTYPSQLHRKTFPRDSYDLIVLDEFHRAGAKRWGERIEKLLAANPNAKVLGTSATHIRYLDNERNMGDEIFDGNVVSYLPLREAITKGIIPNPTYVYSAYSLHDDAALRRKRILESDNTAQWKKQHLRQLKKFTHDWNNANGVPRILRKYLMHDIQRLIVFCPNTDKASMARQWIARWFRIAGFNNLRFYNIDYKESRLETEMNDFRKPCEKGQVKIAISVNMLNEGIHVPRVDAVMMLRSTMSRIILEQQIGRCLTADNRDRVPVILDMVNNMESVRYDFRHIIGNGTNEKDNETTENFAFSVTDESADIRDFFERLDNELSLRKTRTLEECILEGRKYRTRISFRNGSSDIYRYTINHGWADIVMAHMPKPRRWTLEEALEEARRYSNPKSLMDANYGLYRTILTKKGWKEVCFAHMTYLQQTWTKEQAHAEALRYNTVKEFRTNSPSAYNWIAQRKLQKEMFAHMQPSHRTWDDESIRAAALECKTRQEFIDRYPGAYNRACTRKIVDDVCSHMGKVVHRTLQECLSTAQKYKTRKELHDADPHTYDYIISHDWKKECFAHMSHGREELAYTLEECLSEARKYKSRTDFQKHCGRYYRTIKKNHWEEEYYKAIPSPNDGIYTHEAVLSEASKYENIKQFIKGNEGAYRAAKRNGWLEELVFKS